MIRVVSFGAGRQSTTVLLKALDGDFGALPDCAVFADTQWEPKAVYEWLERIREHVAPFPIHVVTTGSIKESALRSSVGKYKHDDGRVTTMPYFLRNPDGSAGMGRRQCTSEFKLKPLRRFFRSLGATRKNPVESWIGISTDEAIRMKPSRVLYAVNRYPLIEAGMSVEDCQRYLIDRLGAPAPKSSCIGCPFKSDGSWARMKAEDPEAFADAVELDRAIRRARGMNAEQFLHRSLIPLGEIAEFRHEKQFRMFEDGFGNECEGVCGV